MNDELEAGMVDVLIPGSAGQMFCHPLNSTWLFPCRETPFRCGSAAEPLHMHVRCTRKREVVRGPLIDTVSFACSLSGD